ncbi:cytochrome P450 [Candidatus Binatia bacterium]|nr:cytochrome P450 [Candidatus Binatia bacterium]
MDLLDLRHFEAGGPPYELFARLRRESPIHWHAEQGGPGFWAVTRYDDVVEVSRDSATYSSYAGGTMIADATPEQLFVVRQMMLNLDPPQHTKLRALINKGFTPRMVALLHDRIGELARAIVDRVAERGACDFVTDVAGELPSYVIAELMGIPLDDGRELYRLTERMHTADRTPEGLASGTQAIFEMLSYANGIRAEKRERPANDIASTLLAAEVDGEKLTDLEFDMFFLLLINAGGDTTRNLVAGGMLELLRRPDVLRTLRDEPRLLPGAIEEMLRFCSPVVHFRRTATRDVVLGGQAIAGGDKVVVFYSSANRDETVFPDPDTLDIARSPNEHVAFGGGGVHYCLGANLARVEIRALFGEVLSRLNDMELAGPVERLRSNFINGPRHMPVRFRAH